MKRLKILITGGAGYIGSMLCTKLVKIGHEVTVLDKLVYSTNSIHHLFFYKNFKFYNIDVQKKKLVKKHLKGKDLIIPLAGLVGAPLCKKNKKLAIAINLNSIKFLMDNKLEKQKVIYLTTNSGYGVGEKNKFCDENSELRPVSLYGRTKNDAEKYALKHNNVVCFRLATVFGYSYRMRTDLLVNNFVFTALKLKKLLIFEPNFRRNFIHINDVIEAITFSIKNFSLLKNDVYNLGLSSANITKLMLAKKIKKKIPKLKIKTIKNRKDPDQRDYFVSNKKIEDKGFKATISLSTGIDELIKVFSNYKAKIINNY